MEGVWHFRWYVTSILNVEMLNPKLCSGLQWWKLWFWRWCPFLKKQDQAGKLKELTAGTHFTLWYIMLYTFFVPAFFNKLLLMLCWRAYCIFIALVSCVGLPRPTPPQFDTGQTGIYSLCTLTILLTLFLKLDFLVVCVYKTCSCEDYTTRFGVIIRSFQLEGANCCMIRVTINCYFLIY